MNSAGILALPLTEAQKETILLLEEALAEAKKGNVDGAGVILCMNGGFATVFGGEKPGDLALGLMKMQRDLINVVSGMSSPKPKRPAIFRAQ
jgi:hypothetical protein